jgi:hypothetical protein
MSSVMGSDLKRWLAKEQERTPAGKNTHQPEPRQRSRWTRSRVSAEWTWSSIFLALLCLIYVVSAFVVALTSAFILTPVVPVIVVTIPPGRQKPAKLILLGQNARMCEREGRGGAKSSLQPVA